uniref:Uncharacterized protein n=1 Tax=Eutreptiella gymnastica TaxID=73025 RepID=A0A7S1HYF8_9EUGL|mmetsp:Transcript_114747/g.199591  ORF Transcript_114747/g.199591 Transcript_114747/m.199591 type:complete len:137 (+) Transcript_114747:53-463(+)
MPLQKQIIFTDKAPAAVGPYSQAVKVGELVYISGQIPINPASGKVEAETVEDQAKQVMENLAAILEAAGSDFSKVVKTTVLLEEMGDFGKINPIYASYFTDGQPPARACYAVDKLPLGVKIEIEAIAICPPASTEQ